MANYEAMLLVKQLNIIRQEAGNKNMLSAKGAMWQKASQELAEAGRSLAGATGNIAPAWDDGAGTKFVQVSRKTLSEIDTWKSNIDGAKPHDAIYLVANTLEPTLGIVEEQWTLAMKAVATAQANAIASGQPFGEAEMNAVMLPFQQTAGRAMNTLGGLYEDAAKAVTAASGGNELSNPQAPFGGSPMSSPSTSAASPSGAPPGGAPPGGAAPGGAAPGGAAPGGAAPGGAAPGGAAGGAPAGAGAGAAGADPSLAGGLSGGAPAPTPTLPPGLGTTPPPVPGGAGTVPPFIPPVGGLAGAARAGGFGGGFGGGGGGGARIPGVGLGGGAAGAQTSIPAAGATISTPTQPAQAGAPAVPQVPPAGGGTVGGGGAGGVPPMMPPMGGMGAGMGGGGGTGPGSGAAQRPVHGRPRGDGRTPGLPPVLSGKAGKTDAHTFAVRGRRSTVETDVPTTVQLIDEDLWQVDRSAATVTGQRRAH